MPQNLIFFFFIFFSFPHSSLLLRMLMHIIYKQAHETASYAKALQTGAVREDEMRA